VCEIWDLFTQLGMPRKKPFADVYTQVSREQWEAFARWDREHNKSRVVRPWKAIEHSQLGRVEVGGLDPRVGISNPPYEQLEKICETQWLAFARVAAMAPALSVSTSVSAAAQDGVSVVTVRVANDGYLPTYVLDSAKALNHAAAPWIEIATQGVTLVDATRRRLEIGHLEGYGRGLYAHSFFWLRSKGSVSERTLNLAVRGQGSVTLRVGCHRTGFLTHEVTVGAPQA
jgi:hypothetical protein